MPEAPIIPEGQSLRRKRRRVRPVRTHRRTHSGITPFHLSCTRGSLAGPALRNQEPGRSQRGTGQGEQERTGKDLQRPRGRLHASRESQRSVFSLFALQESSRDRFHCLSMVQGDERVRAGACAGPPSKPVRVDRTHSVIQNTVPWCRTQDGAPGSHRMAEAGGKVSRPQPRGDPTATRRSPRTRESTTLPAADLTSQRGLRSEAKGERDA